MKSSITLVETSSALKDAVMNIKEEKRIGFDLEADSLHHFPEKVCLLQVATKNKIFVIDTIKLKELSLLKPIFCSKGITKIFHGADYDIRSLFRDFNIEINNLFDSELASRFLGVKETGLDAVIRQRFNIALEKKFRKSDWSKRPLIDDMLYYAVDDVRYLVPLSLILEKELNDIGRLSWVREECDILCKVRSDTNNNEPLFLKFKGAGKLKPENLAILEALLGFRKKVAQKKDVPLFKIIGNASLLKLAEMRTDSIKKIITAKALSKKQIDMYGKELLAIIHKTMNTRQDMLPVYPKKKTTAIPATALQRIEAIKTWRDKKAAKLNIDSGLMLNKALITAIGINNPVSLAELEKISGMKNWQRSEFGEEILSILKKINSK